MGHRCMMLTWSSVRPGTALRRASTVPGLSCACSELAVSDAELHAQACSDACLVVEELGGVGVCEPNLLADLRVGLAGGLLGSH